ncbi:MAG: transcription termination factor Rho [Candidatus Xiphinematobacter sp.]|nr:MAG: transcription termination factor Rho [Candidatus Xiphinematobacter sp.]
MVKAKLPPGRESPLYAPCQKREGVLSLDFLQKKSLQELIDLARRRNIRMRPEVSRHYLVLDLVRSALAVQEIVAGGGMLEISGTHGVLRSSLFNFKPNVEDVQIPATIIRQFSLKPGLEIHGSICTAMDRGGGLVLKSVHTIEGVEATNWTAAKDFEQLTPIFPQRRLVLENRAYPSIAVRAVDIIAPLGRGQRGLIVSPPRAGKTMLMRDIARAIIANHCDVHLILLLVDERPEEVTDLRRDVRAEVISSTFDEPITRHVQVCELVAERAKRLVELGKDVVILLDSITRMARGYNNLRPKKDRTMSGGVASKALTRPRKFFSAARNIEEGGSLTILATALIDTQSRMDDLIFEEFKGTGNMEVHLDRTIAEQRIFPALHIVKSSTRREELLYHPDEYQRVLLLRRQLSGLPAAEAMQIFAANLETTRTNAELLLVGLRGI